MLSDFNINKVVVAIGVFDGVHLGHQRLLDTLCKMAKKCEATPVILTFYPHPREVLNSDSPIRLLTTQQQKMELFGNFGLKAAVIFPFTKSFAALEPEEFIHECLLANQVKLTGICVGNEWRFGNKGRGSIGMLKAFANEGHFDFEAVEELELNGKTVSSTEIRRAISGGRLSEAESMLGRPYRISGQVIHGKKIASTELTFPTANLKPKNGTIPPRGVYAGYAIVEGKKHIAAIAVGVAPTFHFEEKQELKIEVHLLEFSGDLYDSELEVEFIKYIREERCYNTPEQLKKQIADDIDKIRRVLKYE